MIPRTLWACPLIYRVMNILPLAAALLGMMPFQDGNSIKRALADKAAGFWIYEDVEAGVAEARRTGKPLLVSIR